MIKQALLTAAANRRRLKREDRPSRRVSASAVASSITGGTTPLRRSTRPYSGPRAALGAPGLAAIARNVPLSRSRLIAGRGLLLPPVTPAAQGGGHPRAPANAFQLTGKEVCQAYALTPLETPLRGLLWRRSVISRARA